MRLIFMGTPEFAVPSLEILKNAGYEIVSVITAPDKPAGRGQAMTETAVKKFALTHNLPILQPERLKNPEFLEYLASLKADLQIVVAFRMLPKEVWSMPSMGTFNLHASLLPQYRGAAPINRAIMNGESETGLSTFFLNENIDTGNILFQERMLIGDHETAGELHDRMKAKGASLVLQTVQAIANKTFTEQAQKGLDGDLKTAPKLFKADSLINWNQPIQHVFNQIRGLSPYPAAFTYLEEKQLKIYKAEILPPNESDKALGSFETDGKSYLHIQANGGRLNLLEIQLESKKKMIVGDFLKGFRIKSLN